MRGHLLPRQFAALPFSALDEMTGQRLRDEFLALVRENGKTAVIITHSINEALQLGDRIVVLTRPARIAYEVRLSREDSQQHTNEHIRPKILQTLAA